jgi:hypothetical protein
MNRTQKSMILIVAIVVAFVPRSAEADYVFGPAENLGPAINTPLHDYDPGLSGDGLCLVFFRLALDESTLEGWAARRATRSAPWGDPVSVGLWLDTDASIIAMANAYDEVLQGETIPGWDTADGLETYFSDDRPGGYGGTDLYVQKRASVDAEWGPPENLGPNVNTPNNDIWGPISADGLTLYFSSFGRPDGYGRSDLYVTTRATRSDPWGVATNLGPAVNSPSYDIHPSISPDGLLFFFVSGRPGGLGGDDLWMTRRASLSDPWEQAVHLGAALNSPADDGTPYISPDGSALYFCSNRAGGHGGLDLWRAPITPVVDFNGDGKVDGKEVLAIAEHWEQNKSAYDVGPTPLGDGVVDANDLKVLAEYVGQDVNDPSLIAHWALDETAGMIAADSAGDNDAMVLGGAAWQAEGKIGGALVFDGKDDFARSAKPVLDPAQGPFSVIAWIKGGGPNRVIVSQAGRTDWLYLNQYGMLTTDLKSSGKDGKTLTSDAYVLDDQWHRVVLTWDGTNRTLQMDGAEVKRDTQPPLAASTGNLLIGAGKTLAPASFWTGLIDDVRVYNRAVSP